jgi:IMP dehydrogenase
VYLDTTVSNICFDDILLLPSRSNIKSRSNITAETKLGNPKNPDAVIHMPNPFMSAPMEFINSKKMVEEITEYGGIAFVHRFSAPEIRFEQIEYHMKNSKYPNRIGFSVSNTEAVDKQFIDKVLSLGVRIILIDTAFGHTDFSVNAVKGLRELCPSHIHIMTGNVSSFEAYRDLMDAGADSVRVGIGGGAACTTRVVTGFGQPVLSSVIDIYERIKQDEYNGLISDGGIKNNGDAVKALAAGASAIMMGNFFAGHEECEKDKDGNLKFRGLASLGIQTIQGANVPIDRLHIEGAEGILKSKGSVKNSIQQLINNIKSGMSYCGAEDLKSLRRDSKFIKVSPQSMLESNSRI